MAISRETAEPSLQSASSLTLPCCFHGAHCRGRAEEEIRLWQHTAQPLFSGKNLNFSVLERKRGLLGLHGNLDLFHPSLSSLVPPVWYTAACYDCLKLSLVSWIVWGLSSTIAGAPKWHSGPVFRKSGNSLFFDCFIWLLLALSLTLSHRFWEDGAGGRECRPEGSAASMLPADLITVWPYSSHLKKKHHKYYLHLFYFHQFLHFPKSHWMDSQMRKT